MINGLRGATIWSENLDNLLPFYRDLLGLPVGLQIPGFVVLGELGKPVLALGTHSEVHGRNTDPARHMVGLGTEVVIEGEHEMMTYWVLGEGEQHHGDNVISFQSAVGRALMGHTIGDEVELSLEVDAGARRYRIVSVEKKLPPEEAETTGGSS